MLADLIKIHCLTHGATFPMSRTSRIVVCKEGDQEHSLSSNFPNQEPWVYCCNCQTFIAWDTTRADVSFKECPFCLSALNPRIYCCDHCAVTTVDYDDQTLRKQYVVLSWGVPQPACPGCHKFPNSTPMLHFCEALKSAFATARGECPFCGKSIVNTMELAGQNGVKLSHPIPTKMKADPDSALAEAQVKERDAEERIRSAEATARKEVELRVQAERRVEEIKRKVTRELIAPQAVTLEPDWARREAQIARAKAEEEAHARLEAEAHTREVEELLHHAEAAARSEAEMREIAEQKARELAETFSLARRSDSTPRKDKIMIALYASLAGVLFILLILLVGTMIRIAGL